MVGDKVSIIVPVYNSERYLCECVESLLSQDYQNIEILLVNDGSSDSSGDIIDEFAKKDQRIKPIHIKNSGVSTARNNGLEKATGEWITFVDSDDWAENNMISFALTNAIKSEADILIWSYYKNYTDKELPLSLLPGGNQVITENKDMFHLKAIYLLYGEDRIKESVSSGAVWCKLYRRSLLVDNNLKFKVGLTRAQDTVFSMHAFEYAKKIVYFDKHLYHYRITNSSTCSGTRYITDTEKPFNQLLFEFSEFIKKHNKKSSEYTKAFNGRTIQVLLWHLKHNYFHRNNNRGIFQKRADIKKLINKEPYKTALENVSLNLLPKKEKVLVMLFRYKFILTFYAIYLLQNKKENMTNRKFE